MSRFMDELSYAGSPYVGQASLTNMNTDFMSAFDQMAKEYYEKTGKQIKIDDAWRSYEAQAEAYRKKPKLAAPPGHSLHEQGKAMDINTNQANELAQMGLLEKYGFHRPMLGKGGGKDEPWHIQYGQAKKSEGGGFIAQLGSIIGPSSAEAAEPPAGGFMSELNTISPDFQKGLEDIQTEPSEGPSAMQRLAGFLGPAKESIMESPERLKREVTKPFSYLPAIAETAGLMGGGPLGYAGARQTVGRVRQLMGEEPPPQTFMEAAAPVGQDIYEGTKMELEGRALAKGVPIIAKGIGKVARPFFGQIGGTGKAPLEVAGRLSEDFRAAMRGEISGEDIVNNAKDALTRLKDVRGDAYTQAFRNLPQKNIDMTPVQRDLESLMQRYRVKTGPAGEIDVSGSSVGSQAQNEIKKIIETVRNWKDTSVEGMDALKRQIADYYSPSSQARQFTTSLKNSIGDAITKAVPEYGAMTKAYNEATALIKDIEHDLMLRYQKPGISGRMTADKTLRRLASSMKDNFEMRRELVQILGQKGQEKLEEQVAGYAMSSWMPRGAAGVVAGGEAMAATMLGQILNPKMWGVLLAASPRIQGEFLTVMAKGMKELRGVEVPVGKLIAFLANQQWEAKNRDKGSYTPPVFEEPKSPEKVEPESKRGFTILNQ